MVLIHGITAELEGTWSRVMPFAGAPVYGDRSRPAGTATAAPRGDYSLGAHASIRDLLAALGDERATIVGHSLGGGVAMQFDYQFPQR